MAKKLKSESFFELTYLSDPQLSPDGSQVAVVQTVIETKEGDEPPLYRSQIHLYDTQSGASSAFTQAAKSSTRPRFSPDGGQLAFLSNREGDKNQLYLISLAGGEARRLTDLKAGVGEFVWSPDGTRIAFVSRGDYEKPKEGQPRTIDRMFYKSDGLGFRPTEPAQVYLYGLEKDKLQTLTEGGFDPSGLAFSPDGKLLYFCMPESGEAHDAWQQTLWSLSLKNNKLKRLFRDQRLHTPVPSPDGRSIAFFSSTDPQNFASPTGIWVMPTGGGEPNLISGELETLPSLNGDSRYGALPNVPVWAEDSSAVYVNANREGRSGLTRVGLTGLLEPLQEGDRAVTSFSMAGGLLAFTAETPSQPGELFIKNALGEERQLSHVNQAFTDRYRLSESVTERQVRVEERPEASYWILAPDKPRKDGALIMQIHGGPHTNYGYGFSFEFQLMASEGYTVVYGNPQGSSSYGEYFATVMQGAYGTVDADDLLAIARDARAQHAKADAPMHLTGGSYGGVMTNWLVGHTDEFRSAVTQRSICNWISFYGASDIGYRFTETEIGGNPWDDFEKLWQQSPLKYVANVRTPLLILHSEEDHRCPVEQAEQFFIALKRLSNASTRLIRFPGEGHDLSRSGRPDRRVARLEAILGWFAEHA